jgi:indoleacetamide hydrolase
MGWTTVETSPEDWIFMKWPVNRREFLGASDLGWAAASAACRSTGFDTPQEFSDLTATAAVARMRNGETKAEDYARALLDRAQRLERLNAFRVLDREAVLEAARAADKSRASGARLGLLHGLPVPVKDSVNTAALPTSNGMRALREFRPKADAAVLVRLLAQGAIVMGKTNLHELSLGWTSNNATFGAVHNPYDPERVPGGSSGGSAVAVAARMAPLAIAEDTLGSIRIPSTMCGLAGFRPTYGRYPDDGIMPLSNSKFDQVGPVARSVEDLALFDTAITGEATPLSAVDLKGVRIGVADYFMSDLDPEVERIATEALERLRAAGATLVKADLPDEVKSTLPVALTVITYELRGALSRFLETQETGVTFDQMVEQAGPDIRALLKNRPPPREAYDSMLAQRQRIREAIRAHFAKHDIVALAFPPAMIAPPKIGDDGDDTIRGRTFPRTTTLGRNVSLSSCASLASLVLPAGMTSSGLPIGLEFDALPGEDRRSLAVGLSLERALGPVAAPRV